MSRIRDLFKLLNLSEWDGEEDSDYYDYSDDEYDEEDFPDINPISFEFLVDIFDKFLPVSEEIKKLNLKNKNEPLPKKFIDMYKKTFNDINEIWYKYDDSTHKEMSRKDYFYADFKNDVVFIPEDGIFELDKNPTIRDVKDIVDSMNVYIDFFEKLFSNNKHYPHLAKEHDVIKCKKLISELKNNFKVIR